MVVDSLLRIAQSQRADGLLLTADSAPTLELGDEHKVLSMPPLGSEILDMVVEELVPAGERARLRTEEAVDASYELDGVAYDVRIEQRGDAAAIIFRPANATKAATTSAAPAPPPEARPASPAPPAPDRIAFETTLGGGESYERLTALLAAVDEYRASDLLLSSDRDPRLKVGGQWNVLAHGALSTDEMVANLVPRLSEAERRRFEESGSVDFALPADPVRGTGRFRVNLFRQHRGVAAALRPTQRAAPTLAALHLPSELADLVQLRDGLVLMTGPTGSGKSTTLVALVEHLCRTTSKHVITLEDPIEYEYDEGRALVHQREVGRHIPSFAEGLHASLRETPDVILVGEMRDRETIEAVLTAAETGHLVLSTLHCGSAPMVIDRIVGVFPEHRRDEIRIQLASSLRAVMTQALLPSTRPPLRVPAFELLRVNTAVATKIREGRAHQLASEIQKGRGDKMITFESSLDRLVHQGLLAPQQAAAAARDPALLSSR